MKRDSLLTRILAYIIVLTMVFGLIGCDNAGNRSSDGPDTTLAPDGGSGEDGSGQDGQSGPEGTAVTGYHEVKFALPEGMSAEEKESITLPETLMLKDGATMAEIPGAERDGMMFLGWYYDETLTHMTGTNDVIDHNLTLYPRFGAREGMDGTFSYDYVAKRDVDTDYTVLVVSHEKRSAEELKELLAVRNLSRSEEIPDFTVEEYHGRVDGLLSGDTGYEPDEEVAELLRKVGIDPEAEKLPDLYELYGLTENDSPERYWREELRLDPDKVVLIQDAVNALKMKEWNDAGIYSVKPASGLWTDGSLEQVEILDTAALRFIFEDQETDERIIYHNFTVTKKEYNDVRLNSKMEYIPLSQVGGIDELDSLLKLVADDNGQDVIQAERSGVLTTSRELSRDQIIAVYDGSLGEGGTVDGDVSYFKITKVLGGGSYEYEGAGVLDVIDTPVVIPVPAGDNPESGTVVLTAQDLTFDKPVHKLLKLGASTTIGAGSYILFYEGELSDTLSGLNSSMKSIGKITGVTEEGDGLKVEYTASSLDDMHMSQGMYMSVDQVDIPVTEEDIENIRQSLQEQMEKTEYARLTGEYIVNLINGDVDLPDDPEMADAFKNMTFQTDTGEEISLDELRLLAGGKRVEFSGLKADFTMAPKLEHFSGSGVRAVFSAGFTIKIHLNGDNILEIKVVSQIEQEILLGYRLDFDIVWDVVIPVDAIIEAALQAGTFTCFSAQATIMTKTDEKNTEWSRLLETTGANTNPNKDSAQAFVDFGQQLKNLSKELKKVQGGTYSKGKGEEATLGATDDADVGPGASMGGDLPQKYSAMLENDSEYIPIIEQELFGTEFHLDPWQVIAVGFSASLIISWKLNAMIGFSISYGNAKQFCYHIDIAEGEVKKQVGDLETPNFRIDFFLFGMVGLRAGVKFDLRLGLISTKLDSIGITAEVGLYIELYGFLYMFYAWRSGEGSNSGVMGSLLFEIGAYLEINFKAQLGDDALNYEKSLYEKKWPLLSLGAKSVPVPPPVNSDDDEEIYETLEIESGKNTIKVPDSVFKVYTMELDSGELGDESWDTSKVGSENYSFTINGRKYTQYNEEHFTVSCTDLDGENGEALKTHSFQYLPATNEIYIKPADNTKDEFWGEVSFIFQNDSFGFSTVDIKRTLKVHWKGEPVSAVVEYYLQNEDGTGYDLVKEGAFDGFDGIEYDLVISKEFIFQYPGYYMTGIRYPGISEVKDLEAKAYKELKEAEDAYKKYKISEKKFNKARDKWEQIYDRYQNYYENIINTMENYGGVLYFLMVKDETLVQLYFDRVPDHNINPVMVSRMPEPDGNYFCLTYNMTIRTGENIAAALKDYKDRFEAAGSASITWYYAKRDGLKTYPHKTEYINGKYVTTVSRYNMQDDMVSYYLPTYRELYDSEIKEMIRTADGWEKLDDEMVMPDEGIVIFGVTKHDRMYTVTWKDDEGNILREDEIMVGEPVTSPPDVEKKNKPGYHRMIQWVNDDGVINSWGKIYGDRTYTLQYKDTPEYQNISWIVDGETWDYGRIRTDEEVKLENYAYYLGGNRKKKYNSLDKEGYTKTMYLVKGDLKAEYEPGIKMPAGGLTVQVEYTLNSHNVKWMDQDTVVKEETLDYGAALSAPEVSVGENEYFAWMLDDKVLGSNATVPDRDIVITSSRHLHEYEFVRDIKKATCKDPGVAVYKCKHCGLEVRRETEVDPDAHVWGNHSWTIANCVDKRVDYWTCEICGLEKTEEGDIDPDRHWCDIYNGGDHYEDEIPATCIKDGRTRARYCDKCGELIEGGEVIPATGEHDWVLTEEKEATCEEKGVKKYVCSMCGEEKTEETEALGHDWGEVNIEYSDDYTSARAWRVCKRDPSHIEEEIIELERVVTKEPTCTEKGKASKVTGTFTNPAFAPVDIEADEIELPMIPHKWGEPEYTWSSDWGTVTARCVCEYDTDHTHVAEEKVTVSIVTTTPATDSEPGVRSYIARFKNEPFTTQTKTEAIPARNKNTESSVISYTGGGGGSSGGGSSGGGSTGGESEAATPQEEVTPAPSEGDEEETPPSEEEEDDTPEETVAWPYAEHIEHDGGATLVELHPGLTNKNNPVLIGLIDCGTRTTLVDLLGGDASRLNGTTLNDVRDVLFAEDSMMAVTVELPSTERNTGDRSSFVVDAVFDFYGDSGNTTLSDIYTALCVNRQSDYTIRVTVNARDMNGYVGGYYGAAAAVDVDGHGHSSGVVMAPPVIFAGASAFERDVVLDLHITLGTCSDGNHLWSDNDDDMFMNGEEWVVGRDYGGNNRYYYARFLPRRGKRTCLICGAIESSYSYIEYADPVIKYFPVQDGAAITPVPGYYDFTTPVSSATITADFTDHISISVKGSLLYGEQNYSTVADITTNTDRLKTNEGNDPFGIYTSGNPVWQKLFKIYYKDDEHEYVQRIMNGSVNNDNTPRLTVVSSNLGSNNNDTGLNALSGDITISYRFDYGEFAQLSGDYLYYYRPVYIDLTVTAD